MGSGSTDTGQSVAEGGRRVAIPDAADPASAIAIPAATQRQAPPILRNAHVRHTG